MQEVSTNAKRLLQTEGPESMLKADYPKFERALKRFAQKVELDGAILTKRVAVDLFRRIIEKTPVDTGRARASWNIAIGAPDLRVMPEGAYTGEQLSGLKAATVLATYGADARKRLPPIYITNNLPYIVELEKGSSRQAPRGMMALSLMEVTNNLNKLTGA